MRRLLQNGDYYKTATFQILFFCNVHDFAVTITNDFFSMKLQKLEDFFFLFGTFISTMIFKYIIFICTFLF